MALEGSTFAGFAVLERIAQGGMADIYRVADASGHVYVLRMLLPLHKSHWRENKRFQTGCEVLRKLDHPNIVRCFGSGDFNGRRYVILEFVNGSNLREKLFRNDPDLRAHRLKLLVGMAAGLEHVHKSGFLHLDFKPENILISRDHISKIIDFDLSIPRPRKPQRISVLSGTPSYLAPEQIAREPVDERADIFAFGITAYEMLSGKKPITGNTAKEVLAKYADFNNHLRPLHTLVTDIPRAIERTVLKCLEKDVDRRYPSMALVLRDLQS